MVTFVGLQSDFGKALQEMVELEYDAVEAYESALSGLENLDYRETLKAFQKDHSNHIKSLSDLLTQHHLAPPQGASKLKELVTTGKAMISQLRGDLAILRAIHSNEEDINTAYERLIAHEGFWPDAHDIVHKAFADEKRHKEWVESVLKRD